MKYFGINSNGPLSKQIHFSKTFPPSQSGLSYPTAPFLDDPIFPSSLTLHLCQYNPFLPPHNCTHRFSSIFSAIFNSLNSITSTGFCCHAGFVLLAYFGLGCYCWCQENGINWVFSLKLSFFYAPLLGDVRKRYSSLGNMRFEKIFRDFH